MTYHLPRVMHWAQNGSLSHYPTQELRQLYLGPGAELVLLHLFLLSGGDVLSGVVQWASMVGCVVAAGGIAHQLGAGPAARDLARLFAATLPMGVLQAVSTQNDLVVAFWVACAVYFGLEARDEPRGAPLAALGASIGLAILTKATACLFLAPLVLWLASRWLRRHRGRAVGALLLTAALPLCLDGPHLLRNIRAFNDPLTPDLGRYSYTNERISAGVAFSNLLRNVALHLGLPSDAVNTTIERAVRNLHDSLGLDVADPATSWPDTSFRVGFPIAEDATGNPLHLLGFLAALAVVGGRSLRRRKQPLLLAYATVPLAGALLFALVLKWQPWHARLHLPLFILAAPLVGTVFGPWLGNRSTAVLAILLTAQALPFVLLNPNHPVIGLHSVFRQGRVEQTFYARPDLGDGYRRGVLALRRLGCDRVGLKLPANGWEYPLWVLLRRSDGQTPRLEAVDVENASRQLSVGPFHPCAVICPLCSDAWTAEYRRRFGEPTTGPGRVLVFDLGEDERPYR